jgi:hypothetical protein
MKNITSSLKFAVLFLGFCLFVQTADAQPETIKICSTTVTSLKDASLVPMKITIQNQMDGRIKGTILQSVDGAESKYEEEVSILDNPVRGDLNADSNVAELNKSEIYILHAMRLSAPEFGGIYTSGVELEKVRHAKVYLLGKSTKMGAIAVVETQDELGRDLGSFLGGFLVSPCK